MSVAVSLLASQSDARLVRLVAQGHDRAFEAIVERYRAPLGRYLRRLLAPQVADEVLQASFVAAWQALRAGAQVRELRPWLYRIAHNQAVNALRGPAERALPEAIPAPGPHDDLQRREELRATLHGIGTLPDRQRAALVAVAVADRPHADVARELGLSDGGLRQLLLRARTALRAAATALTAPPVAGWLAAGQDSTAARVAEVVTGAGGIGVAAKVGAVVLATGAAVGGTAAVTHQTDRAEATATPAREAPTAPTRTTATPAREAPTAPTRTTATTATGRSTAAPRRRAPRPGRRAEARDAAAPPASPRRSSSSAPRTATTATTARVAPSSPSPAARRHEANASSEPAAMQTQTAPASAASQDAPEPDEETPAAEETGSPEPEASAVTETSSPTSTKSPKATPRVAPGKPVTTPHGPPAATPSPGAGRPAAPAPEPPDTPSSHGSRDGDDGSTT